MNEIIDYLNKPPQRYDHVFQKNSGSREMVEDPQGEYVKFDDMDLYMFEGGELMKQSVTRMEALEDALRGLLGLVQLLSRNEDIPAEIRARMTDNHRFKDAQRCFPATKWDEYGLSAPSDSDEQR